MSEFARHVVREDVALAWPLPAAVVQRRREKLVRAILGGDVYCHFERAGRRLACAFSNERKYLLGNVVRDWLREAHGAQRFLWCEMLDGALALVLVVDGRVHKEAADVANVDREVGMALARLGPKAPVFAHRDVQVAALESVPQKQVLDVSVRDRLGELRRRNAPIPELALADSLPPVRRLNVGLAWGRRLAVAAGLVALATFAIRWWQDRPDDAATVVVDDRPSVSEAEYQALLEAPDPAALLPAIHRAYRQLLADPLLGANWTVENLAWTRQEGTLAVDISLPTTGGAAQPLALDADVQAAIERHAESRGWALAWREQGGGSATVNIPVTMRGSERSRMPEMPSAANPWHRVRLAEDLLPVGRLRTFGPERNATFVSYLSALAVRDAEWSSAELANWLGARLGGGPLLLESLVLVQSGPWATGELRFRSVYCATADSAGNACADAATS